MWELDYKAEHQRIDAFELWCWRRLLRVPWTARRSNQSILREMSPEYSLEGLVGSPCSPRDSQVFSSSSKASILWHSAFFIVQLSHPYMTTGKTIALSRRTFVIKVLPLLFNMLSRLVIVFLPSPQFRSIDSLAFSLLHGPTLTSIHDYWKNHSFD